MNSSPGTCYDYLLYFRQFFLLRTWFSIEGGGRPVVFIISPTLSLFSIKNMNSFNNTGNK